MPQLNDATLGSLAEVLNHAASTCEQVLRGADESKLNITLHVTQHLLGATLGVLEDEMTPVPLSALAFLAQTTRTLLTQADVQVGLTDLLEKINAHLKTEATSIFVIDPATDKLVIRYAASPVSPTVIGVRMQPGVGVVGWVVKHNEDLIVPSTDLDPRFFSGVDEKTGFITRSILCVPMIKKDAPVGAIEVLNKIEGNFNDNDVTLMQCIAKLVACYF